MFASIDKESKTNSLPLIFNGGYPLFLTYEISAPINLKASTNIFIGLSCIRLLPVRVSSISFFDAKKPVKKRIAVPA